VFEKPELVMRNLLALGTHVQQRLATNPPELAGRRWEIPTVLPTRDSEGHWVEHNGEFWRSISYIGAATTSDVIRDGGHAREVGYGLGMFHHLISDLPTCDLADTLEGFHITPSYLKHYDTVCSDQSEKLEKRLSLDPQLKRAIDFVERRRDCVDVLEVACARGELQRRPIHGDPKINNVMLDEHTGHAVGLIDLDTVKPGLVHYDIGDCLRSCCNPLGEETLQVELVKFDLNLCRAILEGYLMMGRSFLSDQDFRYLPDCIRLIPFELGLRFLTDYLDGDRYFRTDRTSHNLDRALVQFALTQSIEAQEDDLQLMIRELSGVS
jgi:Ser/Thr protein kinase RdoA (MazF antagonist)